MLRREASAWLARLQSGREADVEARFSHWYNGRPDHAAAFDRVKRSYEQAGLLRNSPMSSARDLRNEARTKSHVHPWAAAAALALLVPAGFLLIERGMSGGTNAVMLSTNVGEIRRVDLDDGSKVTLDTATRLEVDVSRTHRKVRLKHGRARFEIAPGREPFTVEAGTAEVVTTASTFDVERAGGRSRIDVLSGNADIRDTSSREDSALALRGGEGVTIEASRMGQVRSLGAGPDWTSGMLQFDATPLGDAVALANRYSSEKIVLSGDVAGLRITGAFRAGDTASLARALAQALGLSLSRSAEGNLLLSRKDGDRHPK